MASRNWNPSEPYVLGLEWPGMRTIAAPLSQDVEYGHTFQADATETIDYASFEIVPQSVAADAINTALITVYRRDNNNVDEGGDELEYGTVESTLVAVNGGTLTGATLVNAATIAAALVTPSDYSYINFAAGNTAALEFATAGLFTGKRILELKLHWAATAAADTDFEPVCVIGLHNGTSLFVSGLPIIDRFGYSTVRTDTLGEINYNSGVALPNCWPWTVADVQSFDTASLRVRFTGFDPGMFLHYAVLEVVWCEENRQAVGALLMGSDTANGQDPMTIGRHSALLRTPAGVDNWAKVADDFYTVTITSGRSPTIGWSVAGAAPLLPLVDSFSVFANHQGRVAPRLPSNVLGAVGADSRILPIKFVTTGGTVPTDFAPYDEAFGARVFNGTYAAQDIEQRSGGGTVTYPWLRFYARIIGDPADVTTIDITTPDGTTSYTATDLLALDEIYDGWRQVTLEWPAGQEPTIINDSSNFNVVFSTTQGSNQNRWEILALDSVGLLIDAPASGNPTYGQGNTQAAYAPDGIGAEAGDAYSDLVVTLHTEVPALADFAVELFTAALGTICDDIYDDVYSDLYGGEPCSTSTCKPDRFSAPMLTWTASALGDAFDHYEIQRKDTLDPTFRTIALLADEDEYAFTDMEARVGIISTYRVRLCRDDDICGDWTSELTLEVPIASTAPCGTLYFSSNATVATNEYLAYTEVFDGTPAEEFGFVEADSVVMQRMYGRFGTQSFHPTERGGVRFERDIVINAIGLPLAYGSDGFNLIRDLAWADLPYVCVKDDLGNRWYSTLIVPSGMWQRTPNIFIASIQVVEATDVPYPVTTQT